MWTVEQYPVAVVLCIVTMLCWGSWANTQKLASRTWRFELFYWDYTIGVVLFALALAFTAGSTGLVGRPFLADLAQAQRHWLASAVIGGVIFNLANILLVAAIDISGMAVAFPVGVGLALVLGVITTYLATGAGNVSMLAMGVLSIALAIVLDSIAYRKLARGSTHTLSKGLALSISAGLLMGGFYSLVARSMGTIELVSGDLTPGKLSPYTTLVMFSLGVFASNFLWNSFVMARPFSGAPVSYRAYFTEGSVRLHLIGILGGVIWNVGLASSILASQAAGPALSYGLGQGATLVGAIWGVFIWKEFKDAPGGTYRLLAAMFLFYVVGLAILVASKV